MTGAAAVIRFRARKQRTPDKGVTLVKPENLEGQREAAKAVRESTDRARAVTGQRGAVANIVSRLAEIRERNHFAEGMKAALRGDDA